MDRRTFGKVVAGPLISMIAGVKSTKAIAKRGTIQMQFYSNGEWIPAGPVQEFKGQIEAMKIHPRALTHAEVKRLYS